MQVVLFAKKMYVYINCRCCCKKSDHPVKIYNFSFTTRKINPWDLPPRKPFKIMTI